MKRKTVNLTFDLDLINVMYGVVFAYGFNFFDFAKTPADFFRFFFAYAMLIIDWLYSHHSYQDQKYNKTSLMLDVGVLFMFSRLLKTSTSGESTYFFWLAIIFLLYLVWDKLSQKHKIVNGYDWTYCLAGDSFGAVAFFIIWICLKKELILIDNLWFSIIGFAVYAFSLLLWFKKTETKDILQ